MPIHGAWDMMLSDSRTNCMRMLEPNPSKLSVSRRFERPPLATNISAIPSKMKEAVSAILRKKPRLIEAVPSHSVMPRNSSSRPARELFIKIAVTGRKKPAAKSSHIRDLRRCDS